MLRLVLLLLQTLFMNHGMWAILIESVENVNPTHVNIAILDLVELLGRACAIAWVRNMIYFQGFFEVCFQLVDV